jgi:hypothetical protein
LTSIPCLSEACDPTGATPRFPTVPPFTHPDLAGGPTPADPRVWVLAAVHAILLLTDRDQTLGPAQSRLYAALLKTLFRVDPAPELVDAVHRLLRAWCEKLLYPGPNCDRTPDGVVIGCARVEAGQICAVDSWGGRRWAVHYPLLAYWGEQFGLTPPDVTASRIFDLICCIGDRPPLQFGTDNPGVILMRVPEATNVSVFQVGEAAVLAVGEEKDVTAAASGTGLPRTALTALSLPQFLSQAWSVRGSTLGGSAQQYTHYTTGTLPTVHLLVFTAEKSAVPAQPGRLVDLVSSGAAVAPPLLRTFAADLTGELLKVTPLPPDPANPVIKPLADAGIDSVGGLLSRDPEAVFAGVLGGQNPEKFTALWSAAEKRVADVTAGVVKALPATTPTREQLRTDAGRAALRKGVVAGPGKDVDAVKVDRAIDAALMAQPGGGG